MAFLLQKTGAILRTGRVAMVLPLQKQTLYPPTRVPSNNNILQLRHHRTYMDVKTRPSHSGMFEKTRPQPPPKDDVTWFSTYFYRAALAMGWVYACTEYVVDLTICEGPSMEPTLHSSGEVIMVDKWSVRRYGMEGGSCVGQDRAQAAQKLQQQQQQQQATNEDDDDEVWYAPRISVTDLERERPLSWWDSWKHVRSPLSVGDVVVVQHLNRKGNVCKRVVGLPGDQVLLMTDMGRREPLTVVPDGHIWLEGDNPANSTDSRTYGAVPAALLVGRVLARIWPIRGKAWMRRGSPPRHDPPSLAASASTVLPAGYDGQRIVKSLVGTTKNEDEES